MGWAAGGAGNGAYRMQFELPSNFAPRLQLYGLDDRAYGQLERLWPKVKLAVARAIEEFVEAEKDMPQVAAVFRAHAARLCRLETDHFSLLLSGQIGDE